jgi:hypothetical protein
MKKLTKKQQQEIQAIEKKVSEVCDAKKTIEVTRNDDGVIINKETGKPHFEELLNHLKEVIEDEIEITLTFDESAPSIKKQIKKQGYKMSGNFYKKAELIRTDLYALRRINILTEKDLYKCFKRLNDKICKAIVETTI